MVAGSFRVDKICCLFRISSWMFESESEFFGVQTLFGGLSGYLEVFAFVRGYVVCCLLCKWKIKSINEPRNFTQSDFLVSLDNSGRSVFVYPLT